MILSAISGIYLYKTVLAEKFSRIDDFNGLYGEILQKSANHALSTGDYPYFQKTINDLINHESKNVLSIELVDNHKMIVASSPDAPPVHKKAVRIDIYNQASNEDFLDMGTLMENTPEKKIGYLLIRFNDTHVSDAITQVTHQLLFMLFITIAITIIVYRIINKRIITPYEQVVNYLEGIKDGDLDNIPASHNNHYLCKLIDQVKDRLNNHIKTEELLNSKLRQSKNETNEVRISQYEMIHELVTGIDRPINLSRRLVSSLLGKAPNNDIKEDYSLLSGNIDVIADLVAHSRSMVNNPYKCHTKEPIQISSFFTNISNAHIDNHHSLLSSRNIKDSLLTSYILIDTLQVQLLVEKIINMATTVSMGNEIFINVIIHQSGLSDDKARIIIEIHDSSTGMSHDDARSINLFLNNEKPIPDTNYFKFDDIKTIKHLKRIPDLMINFSPEVGRGNYYHISLECEVSDSIEPMLLDTQPRLSNVISIQEDQPGTLLTEHFRIYGINLKHILFCKVESNIDLILNHDAIVIDVSTNYETAIAIFDLINKHHTNIIAVVSNIQGSDSILIDALYDKGAKDVLRTKYSPESLAESLNKIMNKENSINKYLKDRFLENGNRF